MAVASKINALVAAVILLAVLNLAALGFIWFGRPGQAPRPAAPGANARNFLVAELQLDARQTKQFDSLRQLHFGQVQAYQQQLRGLKDSLFGNLKAGAAYPAAIAEKIGAVQAAIDLQTFGHFAAVRNLCTPAQQQRFDAVIQDAIRQLPGPPNGPPPPESGSAPLPPTDAPPPAAQP